MSEWKRRYRGWRHVVSILGWGVLALALAACASSPEAGDSASSEPAVESIDGLVPIRSAGVALAYIDPEADFGAFRRVAILEPHVAFRANWQRDVNRSRTRRVRSRDMERIRADFAALFKQVFTERLEANDGFEVVDVLDYDVLLLRPSIVDLDVTAPDAPRAGRARTYAAAAVAATLYLQLFDAVSGDLIGRAADRQMVRRGGGRLVWTDGVSNRADASRMMGRWADQLIAFLDSHYVKAEKN